MSVKISKETHKRLKILAIQIEGEVGKLADELLKCGLDQVRMGPQQERRETVCKAIRSALEEHRPIEVFEPKPEPSGNEENKST